MTAIKESSTIQQNKQLVQSKCPVTYTLEKIGGRWKPLILWHLKDGPVRYGQLRRLMSGTTEKMLIQQLRQLEADRLIVRDMKPVVPPHVEYRLSADGVTITPVLNAMAKWGLDRRGLGCV
jgi:DNA-binding HxlR family transcriptional regulator